jgi:peptide/nickel transport system substrate-binding protein
LLTANDQYVLGRPKLDDIEVQFVLDSNVLAAKILAGNVDLTFNRTLSLDQAIEVRNQWQNGRVDITVGGWIVIFPQFVNPNPAIVGDVQFRRAMLEAIDRQAMADTLLGGLSSVAHVVIGPDQPYFNDIQSAVVKYDYDPRKATDIMQSLGYNRGSDGMFRDSSVQPLSVELRTSGEFDMHMSAQLATADYWRRFGVAVNPVVIPPERSADREYVQTFPGFLDYNQPTDVDALKRMVSSQAPLPSNNFVGRNHARFMNPEHDALIDRFFVTIPKDERLDILRQIVHMETDQLSTMGLFYNTSPIMVAGRLKNVDRAFTYNAEQWDVS